MRESIVGVIRAQEDLLRKLTQNDAAQPTATGAAIEALTNVQAIGGTLPATGQESVEDTLWRERPRRATKGTSAIGVTGVQVLKAADGQPLHVNQIKERIEQLGARTEAANPGNVINSILRREADKGAPIENIGSRRWRWISSDQRNSVEAERPFHATEYGRNGTDAIRGLADSVKGLDPELPAGGAPRHEATAESR